MKGWSAAYKAHAALGSTTIATCWKATLTNGTVVRATAHDRNIEYPAASGEIYLSTAAYTPSDVESSADLSPDNLELEGFLASPHITAVDLHSGLWDFAAIEIFEVNYRDLTMGRNRVREGTLGEVKGRTAMFTAELRGLTQAYSRRIVRLIEKECDADLGDARCKISLAAFTVTSAVDTVSSNRTITCALRQPIDWFTAGLVTFTSGPNDGLSMEVKSSDGSRIELHEMMPFTIAVGDTFTVYAGCTNRYAEDCIAKFNNGVNFRGFSHLPGTAVYGGPGTVMPNAGAGGGTTVPPPAPVSVSTPPPAPAPVPATAVWGASTYLGITLLQPQHEPADILQAGNYWIMDGQWGAGDLTRGTYTGLTGTQYETAYGRGTVGAGGEIAWRSAWAWPSGTTEVKAYPASIFGNKPGYYNSWTVPGGSSILLENNTYSTVFPSGKTPNTIMPIAANGAMAAVNAQWTFTHAVVPSGQGHISFDIWLQSSPDQVGGMSVPPISHEIMIPLDYWGGYGAYPTSRPMGWYQHDVTIQGILWHVYMVNPFFMGWRFVVFEPDAAAIPINPGSLNLAEFLNYLVPQGWAAGTESLVDIELGIEPVEGVGDVVFSNYKVSR